MLNDVGQVTHVLLRMRVLSLRMCVGRIDVLDMFGEAAAEAGIPLEEDFTHSDNEGYGYFQVRSMPTASNPPLHGTPRACTRTFRAIPCAPPCVPFIPHSLVCQIGATGHTEARSAGVSVPCVSAPDHGPAQSEGLCA